MKDPSFIHKLLKVIPQLRSERMSSFIETAHSYPLEFLLYMTWPLTVVYYKVNYLPVGIRIWFQVNCGSRVFGDVADFSSEIG